MKFQFNAEGGEIFQKLTGENIGKQLAIVLDDRVYSAPVIRSRIGSHGQIEGRFSSAEAADLAVVLRSGSLLAPGGDRGGAHGRAGRSARTRSSRGIHATALAFTLVVALHARLLPRLGRLRGALARR